MRTDTKIAFCIAFLLFVVGDLVSTYTAFSIGGVEGNLILSKISFESIIMCKLVFMCGLYAVVHKLEDWSFARGVTLGSVIAVGLVTTLWNVGFYGGVWG